MVEELLSCWAECAPGQLAAAPEGLSTQSRVINANKSNMEIHAVHRPVGEVLVQELLSCWAECAPGQLAAAPDLTAVHCLEAVLQCLHLLLHHLPSLFPSGMPSSTCLYFTCLQFCSDHCKVLVTVILDLSVYDPSGE